MCSPVSTGNRYRGSFRYGPQTSLNLREGLFHGDKFVPFGALALLASWKFTPSHAVYVCCWSSLLPLS